MKIDQHVGDQDYKNKRSGCLQILTKPLLVYSLETIKHLYVTPVEQVLELHKITVSVGLMPPSMVSIIIFVENYPVLAETPPNLPETDKVDMSLLEKYLTSWKSMKSDGILTCGEHIVFDAPLRACLYSMST